MLGLFNFCSFDNPLSGGLSVIIQLLGLAVLARALLSWFVRDPSHPLLRILIDLTEPILAPIRRRLPPSWMIDLSPLIAIIVINVVWRMIISLVPA